MKLKYDPETDVFYVRFTEAEIVESIESRSGAIVDLDENGEVVGVEVLDFRKKTNAPFAFTIPQAETPEKLRELVLAS